MGKKLVIAGADFSANGIAPSSLEPIYQVTNKSYNGSCDNTGYDSMSENATMQQWTLFVQVTGCTKYSTDAGIACRIGAVKNTSNNTEAAMFVGMNGPNAQTWGFYAKNPSSPTLMASPTNNVLKLGVRRNGSDFYYTTNGTTWSLIDYNMALPDYFRPLAFGGQYTPSTGVSNCYAVTTITAKLWDSNIVDLSEYFA